MRKPKYSKEDKETRLKFSKRVLRMSVAELRVELNLCLDGVVIVIPPKGATNRENFCKAEITHAWLKHGERVDPELHGHTKYSKQAPLERCMPLWGGIGYGGVAPVLWHDTRKIDADDWAGAVRDGSLIEALRAVNPGKTYGPWGILCDNESFLRSRASRRAHEAKNINLWELPPRSPDLNPVEKFWAWLRKQLRDMDLNDLRAKRQVLGRTAYKQRIKAILRNKKAKEVASNCVKGLKKVAKQVVQSKGGASRG